MGASCRCGASCRWAVAVALVAGLIALPKQLRWRDDATRLRWPRPAVPEHGRLRTIQLSSEALERVVAGDWTHASSSADLFAASFDMYYEAQLDECDSERDRAATTSSAV
eukprot:COSAG06_NODE_27093_length_601_cov_1.047809_1_plen_109_part_01